MTTSYSTDATRDYLDRVRALLADLPEEERAEVVQDLAAHLDEMDEGDVDARLGSPEEFVAEFRTMAGLEAGSDRRQGLLDRFVTRIDALTTHPAVSRIVDRWASLRPVWVGIRGWLLVSLLAVVYVDGAAFAPFPVPQVGGSGLGGIVAVAVVTLASVTAARGENAAWRITNGVLNAAVAVFLVGSLLSGTLYGSREVDQRLAEREWQVLEAVGGMLPRDIVGVTPDGARLDGVLLYDESGRPFDLARLRWQLGLPGPIGEWEGISPDSEEPFNLYPLARHLPEAAETIDPGPGPTPTTTTVP